MTYGCLSMIPGEMLLTTQGEQLSAPAENSLVAGHSRQCSKYRVYNLEVGESTGRMSAGLGRAQAGCLSYGEGGLA